MNEPIFMVEKPPQTIEDVHGGLRKLSLAKWRFIRTGSHAFSLLNFSSAAFAAEPTLPPPAQTKIDFVRDIQPIFSKHCYSCHGPDKQEKELRWDIKAVALKGGVSGPAIIPGNSKESRIIRLVAGLEKDLVMPKKGERLSADQIGLLRAWIDQGVAWPDSAATAAVPDKSDWWSFKPAKRHPLPQVTNGSKTKEPD